MKDPEWVEEIKNAGIELAERNHWGTLVSRTILPDRVVLTFESGQQYTGYVPDKLRHIPGNGYRRH